MPTEAETGVMGPKPRKAAGTRSWKRPGADSPQEPGRRGRGGAALPAPRSQPTDADSGLADNKFLSLTPSSLRSLLTAAPGTNAGLSGGGQAGRAGRGLASTHGLWEDWDPAAFAHQTFPQRPNGKHTPRPGETAPAPAR